DEVCNLLDLVALIAMGKNDGVALLRQIACAVLLASNFFGSVGNPFDDRKRIAIFERNIGGRNTHLFSISFQEFFTRTSGSDPKPLQNASARQRRSRQLARLQIRRWSIP